MRAFVCRVASLFTRWSNGPRSLQWFLSFFSAGDGAADVLVDA